MNFRMRVYTMTAGKDRSCAVCISATHIGVFHEYRQIIYDGNVGRDAGVRIDFGGLRR
jgi:hypothetical protein